MSALQKEWIVILSGMLPVGKALCGLNSRNSGREDGPGPSIFGDAVELLLDLISSELPSLALQLITSVLDGLF
jgi:hypothetical protein